MKVSAPNVERGAPARAFSGPTALRRAGIAVALLVLALAVGARSAFADKDDYDSRITKFKAPFLITGKSGKLEMRIENTGTRSWKGADIVLVCSVLKSPSGAKAQRDDLEFRKSFDKIQEVPPGGTLIYDEPITGPEYTGTWLLGCWLEFKHQKFGDVADTKFIVWGGKVSGRITAKHGLTLVDPGEKLDVTFSVVNDGDGAWELEDADSKPIRLDVQCQDGPDGLSSRGVEDFRGDTEIPRRIPAKQGMELSVELKVPPFTGSYKMTAQLLHGEEPISDAYEFEAELERTLNAQLSSVKFGGDTKKATLAAGKRHEVDVRVSNTGKAAWNAIKYLVLRVTVTKTVDGRKDVGEKAFESDQKLKSGKPVMPGATFDFGWHVDAPKEPGRWIVEVSMFDLEKKKAFGEKETFEITVP